MRKILGRGGNGRVERRNGLAVKILDRTGRESVERFRIEIEAMQLAQSIGLRNVVPILSVDLSGVPPSYTMPIYDGDLDRVLSRTRHNAKITASIIEPLARTLSDLASANRPIYHRDLKPSNILYRKADGKVEEIHLADFGCAFIATGEERLTQTHRAVGAAQFRPPEYSFGRVKEVSASADIYALGKILWYLCNGVSGEIFPYNLWYPEEYNLVRRGGWAWRFAAESAHCSVRRF